MCSQDDDRLTEGRIKRFHIGLKNKRQTGVTVCQMQTQALTQITDN